MTIQQVAAFRVNPGHRDRFLGVLAEVQANAAAGGASPRAGTVLSGRNAGMVVTATEHESWEAFADYSDASDASPPSQPLLDALRGSDPPATLAGLGIRAQVGDHPAENKSFISSISFDVLSNRPDVVAAIGGMRDLFETVGASSRIFATANGDNPGRLIIVSEFDGLGGWARFRDALQTTADGGTAPLAGVQEHIQGAGISHVRALPL